MYKKTNTCRKISYKCKIVRKVVIEDFQVSVYCYSISFFKLLLSKLKGVNISYEIHSVVILCDSPYEGGRDAFKIAESTIRNIYVTLSRNDVKILRSIVRVLIIFSENVI